MKRTHHKISLRIVSIVALVATITLQFAPFTNNATAAQITSRSLTLQAGASDGGSKPGGVVNHLLSFTLPTTGSVGSIKFQYCTTASGTCTMPTGMLTTSATLGTTTGISGFTIVNTTNGAPYITHSPALAITGPLAVTVPLNTITNPTTLNSTFFVRITSYVATDTTGASTDAGTVTAAVTNPIVITGTMPESLVFCAGAVVTTNGSGVPDCTTATSGAVNFNQLFSPTDTATATSQMAASTNAGSGYNITVNGATLTSGSNTITNMATAATGVRGTSQFGLNLKANTTATSTTAVGTEVAPAANGTVYKGQALVGYNTVDTFKFVSGDSVANSANGGAGGSNAQIFTVSYIANVPGNLPAGTYQTTLTYICTATY